MTEEDKTNKLKTLLEALPDDTDMPNGRLIDMSVAISLKRIADKLTTIANALQRPRR